MDSVGADTNAGSTCRSLKRVRAARGCTARTELSCLRECEKPEGPAPRDSRMLLGGQEQPCSLFLIS